MEIISHTHQYYARCCILNLLGCVSLQKQNRVGRTNTYLGRFCSTVPMIRYDLPCFNPICSLHLGWAKKGLTFSSASASVPTGQNRNVQMCMYFNILWWTHRNNEPYLLSAPGPPLSDRYQSPEPDPSASLWLYKLSMRGVILLSASAVRLDEERISDWGRRTCVYHNPCHIHRL